MNLPFGKKKTTEEDPFVGTSSVAVEDASGEDGEQPKKERKDITIPFLSKKPTDPAEMEWESPVRPARLFFPNYISHRKAMQRAIKMTTGIAVWGVTLIALACGGTFAMNFMASQQQADAEIEMSQAQKELKELSKASAFFDGLELREASVNSALSGEVDYSKIVSAVSDALPNGAKLGNLDTKFGQVCASPDPFMAAEAIGCIEYTVTVKTLADAAQFLERANSLNSKYVNSFLVSNTSGSNSESGYTLSGTANFTQEVFTYRFVQKPNDDTAADPTAPVTDPNAPATDPAAPPVTDPAAGAPQTDPTQTGGN